MYPLEICKDCVHEKVCKYIELFTNLKSNNVPLDFDSDLCTAFEPDLRGVEGLLSKAVELSDREIEASLVGYNEEVIRDRIGSRDVEESIKEMQNNILSLVERYKKDNGVYPDCIKLNSETLEAVQLPSDELPIPGFGVLDIELDDSMPFGTFGLGHTEYGDEEEEDEEDGK